MISGNFAERSLKNICINGDGHNLLLNKYQWWLQNCSAYFSHKKG